PPHPPSFPTRRSSDLFVAAPRPELYDLQQDPTESRNIYPERQALGDRLNQELIALERGMSPDAPPPRAAVEVDPDARARLAALGDRKSTRLNSSHVAI